MTADQGGPAKNGRLVIGSVIIKHKLNLSDEETVLHIHENPYLQYFVGFFRYQENPPFVLSLFVEIRHRMGSEVFDAFEQAILAGLTNRVKGRFPSQKPPVGPGAESGSSNRKDGNNKPCQNALEKTSKTESDMTTEPAADHKGKLTLMQQ